MFKVCKHTVTIWHTIHEKRIYFVSDSTRMVFYFIDNDELIILFMHFTCDFFVCLLPALIQQKNIIIVHLQIGKTHTSEYIYII